MAGVYGAGVAQLSGSPEDRAGDDAVAPQALVVRVLCWWVRLVAMVVPRALAVCRAWFVALHASPVRFRAGAGAEPPPGRLRAGAGAEPPVCVGMRHKLADEAHFAS